jgi:hypothetical protein
MTDAFVHISGSGKPMCQALGMPEESHYAPQPVRDAQCQLVEWLIDHEDALWALENGLAHVQDFLGDFSNAVVSEHSKVEGRVKTLEDAPKPAPVVAPAPVRACPEWVTRYGEPDMVALRKNCDAADSQIKALIMAHGALDNRVHGLEIAPKPTETSHKPLWYAIIGLVLSHAATVTYLVLHH